MAEKTDPKLKSKRPKSKKARRRNLLTIGVLIIVVIGFAFLALKYNQAQKDVERLSNPEEAVKQETINLTKRVSELVEVPAGQEPTIATVQDVTKLQGQPFFQNAQNGDKVLIYAEAKKAVLYRPSTDKVIEVSPVNIGDNQASPEESGKKTNQ